MPSSVVSMKRISGYAELKCTVFWGGCGPVFNADFVYLAFFAFLAAFFEAFEGRESALAFSVDSIMGLASNFLEVLFAFVAFLVASLGVAGFLEAHSVVVLNLFNRKYGANFRSESDRLAQEEIILLPKERLKDESTMISVMMKTRLEGICEEH